MTMLHPGDARDEVAALQRRLVELGFPPGAIDGSFGPGTEAALRGFQASRGLLADGVAGPRTLNALGLALDAALPSVIPQVTVERTCVLFPATPRANIERYLPVVLQGMVEATLHDKPMVLMALATIRAETESFEPISEGVSRFNTAPGGRPFALYDLRTDLGNGQAGDGERYRGRGFIQLTGKSNYLEHGKAIGLGDSLLTSPDRAGEPAIAAALLVSFLRSKERSIKEALLAGDLAQARRLVNGGAHGLDRFADCYRRGDRLFEAF
jgi:peptidoglycan L-alanyl-D-glutamate endopeptidase CwlK